jgi:hypothetical protein
MPGVPGSSSPGHVRNFVPPATQQANRTITGVTRDQFGTALGTCTVYLINWNSKGFEQTTVSDGSGNYSFVVDPTGQYRVISDDAGNTVAGISLNNLVGV